MSITHPFVLPADVLLLPVADLPDAIREQVECDDDDYAITRPRSRTPSRIIDSQAATLLKEFQQPTTIIDAIIHYSQSSQTDPEQNLEQAFPLLQLLIDAGTLVAPDAEATQTIQPAYAPGDTIADFTIIKCVHVLEDTELYQVQLPSGELAALKLLRPGYSAHHQHMLEREARILRHLDGSISPRLISSGTAQDRAFIAMEWCQGVSAAVAAEQLRYANAGDTRAALLELVTNIVAAYAQLHQQGVLHGDVHPNNVQVSSDGTVRIIDFGLARRIDDPDWGAAPYRGGVGFFFEPEYALAALEQRAVPQASLAGEQYGVAALVYLLLTGNQYLNFSLERLDVLRQIVHEQPLLFSQRGLKSWPEVEETLGIALRKAPEQRYLSMAEFAQQLRQAARPGLRHPVATAMPQAEPANGAALVQRVLERVGYNGASYTAGLPEAPACSLNHGVAGIAYALYRMALVRDDPALCALADVWLTRAERNSTQPTAFYNDQLHMTPATIGQTTPYHTVSGLYCARALMSHAVGDTMALQRAIEGFVAASQAQGSNLDLTTGRAGTVLAAALLLDVMVSANLDTAALIAWVDRLVAGIWDELDARIPLQASHITYLGMAHGWAGILYTTLRWYEATDRPVPETVPVRLHELAQLAKHVGHGAYWSYALPSGDKAASDMVMAGWCHGNAGYVHLWTLAHALLRDPAYLKLAEEAAWGAWEAHERTANACCGLTGRAYALLNLYKHTGDIDWLNRARSLSEQAAALITLSTLPGDNMRDDSLYKGEIGVALLNVEIARPEFAAMPFFERDMLPQRATGAHA